MSELSFISNEFHPYPDVMYQTPQGYDVRDALQAQSYLEEVTDTQIILPKNEEDVFSLLANQPRAARYLDGRRENVYEHSMHLRELVLDAAEIRTDVTEADISLTPEVHDWDEALGGDTEIVDPAAEATRFWRGSANDTLLFKSMPLKNPHMQAYLRYRHSSITGIWTPGALLTKTLDKVASTDFQLRDDVQASMHRETQEAFEPGVAAAMPKVIADPTALSAMFNAQIELGTNWEAWGCKPLIADPFTTVEFYTHHAFAQHIAKINESRNTSNNLAQVAEFIGKRCIDEPPIQRILRPHEVAQFGGNVVLLHSDDGRGPNPPKPVQHRLNRFGNVA